MFIRCVQMNVQSSAGVHFVMVIKDYFFKIISVKTYLICFALTSGSVYRAALHFTSAEPFNLNVQQKTVLLVRRCFKVF